MQNAGISVVGKPALRVLQGGLKNLTPPSGSPIPKPPFPPIPGGGALGVLGVITAAVSVIGLLGGDQFRDSQLAKLGKGYNQNTGLSSGSLNPNTGDKSLSSAPPFTGGQSVGVGYVLVFSRTGGSENESLRRPDGTAIYGDKRPAWIAIGSSGGGIMSYTSASDAVSKFTGSPALGKINGIVSNQLVGGGLTPNRQIVISADSGNITFVSGSNSGFVFGGESYVAYEFAFVGAYRKDGQPDTGGDPSGTPLGTVPSGYTGGETLEDMLRKSLPDTGLAGLNGFPSVAPNALGLGTEKTPKDLLPTPEGKPLSPTAKNPIKSPTPSPIKPVPAIPSAPVPTPSSEPPNTDTDIRNKLAQIIGITTLINSNTQPEQQRQNAKAGSCDALQSPQCTKGVEDRIKDPIMGNVDAAKAQTVANAGAISSIASAFTTFYEIFQNKIGKVLNILNNSVVDRTLAVMNLVTNIHNAAMLTRDIGETLGSVVDNVISLTGLRFTNSEGAQVGFTDVIGANFRAFLIQVLGAERYVELTLNWQKASMILNSAANVVNTTQSMLDPISSAVEYGMENVSKIGNSLKEDGVVSENAYPAMDETIRARRMNRFARLNDTLEGAENIASNLSSITSSAVSVKEDYKQLREDAKDLKDKATAFNTADSEARATLKASLPTDITPVTLAPAPAEDEEP